ncbi:MAG: MarR family transcriptional regulator [Turicibacter sp.]|nr:MarR family transcriptional regulator [Turicibacter sp.]
MNHYEHLKLDNQLCFSLYAASREVIRLYKPILDEYGLTYTQYVTMLVLWENERLTVKEIGQHLHLDSGTLTPLLKKLEGMQYIQRYRDPNDDRVVIVELTVAGRQLKEQMIEVPKRVFCQVGGNLEELISLKKMLDDLLHKLS